jgi:hypothetical protein
MVNIWIIYGNIYIYMVNDLEPYGLSMIFLVGGIPTPLKNEGVRQLG